MSSLAKIERYTSDAMMEMSVAKEQQTPQPREFRTSSLPFCPILSFLREPREESYSMSHYTSVGTAMHTTVQTWLAKTKNSSKHMWGNWICTGCGKKKQHCKQPKPCNCYSKQAFHSEFHRRMQPFWMYEEIEYNYRGLSGHIDLIMWPEPDFAFIGDFKSTDLVKKKSSSYWNPSKPSSPSYIVQIRTYSTVMDLSFDLPIKGWVLINLDRSKPITRLSDFHMIPSEWSHKKSLKWDKKLELASSNNNRLVKLEKAIDKEDEEKSKKYLRSIVNNRPCVDESSYRHWMHYGFYSGECDLKKDCLSCRSKRIESSILSKLNEKG